MKDPDGQRAATDATEQLAGPWRFHASVRDFLRDLSGADQRFWFLVIATGALSGLGAVFLVEFLDLVQSLAWPPGDTLLEAAMRASRWRRLAVLASGGLLVGAVSFWMGRSLGGHGTAGIIEAIWRREGRYSLTRALTNGTMAIISVGLGAPLGREGALISTGAGTGSWLARQLRLGANQERILVACGAASGIAAAYNVPLGAALFGLEVLLGSFALELLGPIVVACVTATFVSRIVLESHPAYEIPYYRLTSPGDLLRFTALAPILGVCSALYVRVIEGAAELGTRFKRYAPLLPVVAMTLVGLVAWKYPEILGNGYEAVNESLLGRLPLGLLIVLPFVKMLATATCSAAGVPGGLFTPSLFFGALLGGAFGTLVQQPGSGAPPGAYALVGMVAVLAGTTHAAVSAVLIMFEMTRDYGVILPLMLASVVSAAVSRRIEPLSLYTAVLRRRNVEVPERTAFPWRETVLVSSLPKHPVATVAPGTPFEEIMLRLMELPAGEDLYVTAPDGRYLGVIVLDSLKGNLPSRAQLAWIVAADVMQLEPKPVREDTPLAEAAEEGAKTHLDRLPVVDAQGRLVSAVSKRDLVRRGQF